MTDQTLTAVTTFIETAPDAMLIVDGDGVIRVANRRACTLFATEDLSGHLVEELLPSRYAGGHAALRQRFADDPTPRVMGAGRELEARRFDGAEFPVDISLGVLDAGGEQMVSVAVRDITARRAAEAHAAQFEFIVESSHEAIFSVDADGLVTTWNEAAQRLTGRSASEAIGRPLGDCLVPGDDAFERRLVHLMAHAVTVAPSRTTIVRADGTRTPVSVSLARIEDAKGNLVGMSGLCRDVTEEVETQQILAEVQNRMAETERLARIGLWAWDVDSGEVQWSAQLHEITGRSPFDFDADLDAHLSVFADEHRADVEAAMRAAVAEGTTLATECNVVLPDGTRRWVALSGDPVFDGDRVVQMRGVCQDITERHEAIEALRTADRLKDEFLGVVSHELRTPLTSIIGFAQVLDDRVDDELRNFTEVILRNGYEMHGMVERILDFSRAQSGLLRLQIEPHRLGDLLEDLRPLVDDALAQHDFVVDCNEELRLNVDASAFRRIFVNLLTNAAKFTPAGGRIWLRASRTDDRCHLQVADEGPGIPLDSLESVFERFLQLESTKHASRRGAGVGLAIVRSYTEAMEGRVWAESPEGCGAVFNVELPLATT